MNEEKVALSFPESATRLRDVSDIRFKWKQEERDRQRRRDAEVDALIARLGDPRVAEKLRIYRLVEDQFAIVQAQVEMEVRENIESRRRRKMNKEPTAGDNLKWDRRLEKRAERLLKETSQLLISEDRRKLGDRSHPVNRLKFSVQTKTTTTAKKQLSSSFNSSPQKEPSVVQPSRARIKPQPRESRPVFSVGFDKDTKKNPQVSNFHNFLGNVKFSTVVHREDTESRRSVSHLSCHLLEGVNISPFPIDRPKLEMTHPARHSVLSVNYTPEVDRLSSLLVDSPSIDEKDIKDEKDKCVEKFSWDKLKDSIGKSGFEGAGDYCEESSRLEETTKEYSVTFEKEDEEDGFSPAEDINEIQVDHSHGRLEGTQPGRSCRLSTISEHSFDSKSKYDKSSVSEIAVSAEEPPRCDGISPKTPPTGTAPLILPEPRLSLSEGPLSESGSIYGDLSNVSLGTQPLEAEVNFCFRNKVLSLVETVNEGPVIPSSGAEEALTDNRTEIVNVSGVGKESYDNCSSAGDNLLSKTSVAATFNEETDDEVTLTRKQSSPVVVVDKLLPTDSEISEGQVIVLANLLSEGEVSQVSTLVLEESQTQKSFTDVDYMADLSSLDANLEGEKKD